MNTVAAILIFAGALALLLRLCSQPKRRRNELILSATSSRELLNILHNITPAANQKQLYGEIKALLEKKSGTETPDELEKVKAIMLLLNS